jgi:ABC-2 type transport system permease protein
VTPGTLARVHAIAAKDLAELRRQPAIFWSTLLLLLGLTAPGFVVLLVLPWATGQALARGDFADAARVAVTTPGLTSLPVEAALQAFLLHQFLMFGLLVPTIGSLSLAAQSFVGEKTGRTLEPLLTTPISTLELLLAKIAVPFAFAAVLAVLTFLLYLVAMAAAGQPGVWQTMFGARTLLLFGVVAPVLSADALLLAAIVSSRVSDARTAQQLASLLVLPVTGLFVAQLAGQFLLGPGTLLGGAAALAVLAAGLLWVGVRLFDRETILMRWR